LDAPPVTLVEALETPLRSPRPRDCLFTRVKDGLNEEEQEAVNKALDKIRSDLNNGQRKVYSTSWLATVLTSQGYSISAATIQRHLRESCGCYTTGEDL
jgi:hypothetical protein